MTTPIKTNQLIYTLNNIEIDTQYDIFAVETSLKYFKSGAYILDAPSLEKNVRAVRFENGRRFHVLLQKDFKNKQLLRKVLSGTPEADTITLSQVQSQSLEDHVLLQLLLNSLGSVDHPLLRFNNLTGHLYCFHPDWVCKSKKEGIIWQVPCLELRITPEYQLRFDVRTFTSEKLKSKITFGKRKFEDYPKYVLSVHNTLRRKLPDDKEIAFIQRQINDEKTGSIDFLRIDSLKGFEASKMGIVSEVIQRFNEQFARLAEIGFTEIPDYIFIDYDNHVKRENAALIQSALEAASVRIVDGIGDDYSKAFCKKLQTLLMEKYKVSAPIGKRITKRCLNLYLIHNSTYYLDGNDPHRKSHPSAAVQHITLEDFVGNVKYALSTVVHELLIKSDLQAGRIRLFDWESLGFTENIAFGLATEDDNSEQYFFMNIHPDGSFDITEQKLTLFEQTEYSDCVDVFEQARQNSKTIKGIIRDNQGHINSIVDTGSVTIPDIFRLREELEKGNTALRGKKKREELLNSVIDIRKFEQDNAICYFVGIIGYGMKNTLHNAANIRKIEPYGNAPNLFEQLLPLMNVTFVRNEQLTVVPFPFKYLMEYIRSFKNLNSEIQSF